MAGFTNQIQVSPIGVSHDISLFTEYMMTLVGKADKLDKITAIVKDNGRLEDVKEAGLEKQIKEKRVSLCFGSKKLFDAQNRLSENGFRSHEGWLHACPCSQEEV